MAALPDPLAVLRKHWGFSGFRSCQHVRGSAGGRVQSLAVPSPLFPTFHRRCALQEVVEAVLQGADTMVVMVREGGGVEAAVAGQAPPRRSVAALQARRLSHQLSDRAPKHFSLS